MYSKYVYKLYTNASYLEEIPNPPSFGYVGPLMRAEVGEVMKVHFRNKIPHPVTVHPHGVRYDKSHEGILFFIPLLLNYDQYNLMKVFVGAQLQLVYEPYRSQMPRFKLKLVQEILQIYQTLLAIWM